MIVQNEPLRYAARNLTFDLIEGAKASPENAALILGHRSISYLELDASAWGATHYLFSNGVRKGDTVALTFSDQFSLVLAFLGVLRLGATALVLAPALTNVQREKIIADSNAVHLFTDNVRYMNKQMSCHSFDETCLSDKSASLDLVCEFPEAFAYIIVGSGSSGVPHLIPISHKVARARSEISNKIFSLKPGTGFMLASPFYFATPIGRFIQIMASGATCIIWDQKTPILQAIHYAKPSILELTVFHAEFLLRRAKDFPEFNLSGIRIVGIGSSIVNETLRQRMKEDLNTNLHVFYGTNESFFLSIASPDDLAQVKDGVGHPPDGVQIEVIDKVGVPVQNGEIGEVRVKTPASIEGYLDGSDADRFQDGWFYPRDLGKWAESGQLIHCGRADQMMILDGINIYPAEIESVLGAHPAVEDIAAFPLRDPVRQDVPVCMVSLKTGADIEGLDLRAYARERLGLQTPRHVMVVKKLPRNEQGKPIRAELERLMREYVKLQLQKPKPLSRQAAALADVPPFLRGSHRQTMRTHSLKFQAPKNIDLEPLDAWRPYFDNPALPCAELESKTTFPPEEAPVAAWFQSVLALTRDALLAVNVPCFEHIQLLECTPVPDRPRVYTAVIAMPGFENYKPHPFGAALEGAISCTGYLQQNMPDKDDLEGQFRTIESKLLDELRNGASYSSINLHVLHAAYQMGIPFWYFGVSVYQMGWGAAAKLIDQSSSTNDATMSNKLTKFKHVTTGLMRDAGLPVPSHSLVSSLEQARIAAERIGWPVVVKPNDLERGEGVQVDVQPDQLQAAYENASNLSKRNQVLVERQIDGVCHRLFVAGGQLLYAVKRLPIGVYGDGLKTVASLVAAEQNIQIRKPSWLRSKTPKLDDLGRAALASQGLTETSIPERDAFVALRRIESTKWGGVDEDVTDIVHPENLRIALQAAKLCGLDVAGIDFITDQISEPWVETDAVISEVNYIPSLGAGDISRRHLPEYVKRLMGGNGRIPVDVFAGDEQALIAAKAHVEILKERDTEVYLTTDAQTFGPMGEDIPLAKTGLRNRVRALVLNNAVEALVIVVLNDKILDEGLPLEGVDAVHLIGEPALSEYGTDPSQRRKNLIKLLSSWTWPQI